MCTRSGIPFFMPFTTARCVLPGNPNLRLSSTDVKAEIVVFFVFVGLIFTVFPLMSQGFWTSYNKTFATFSHLYQEHKRSDDLLHVRTQAGQSGYVVKAEEHKAVLFVEGRFIPISREDCKLAEITHSGWAAQVEDVQFISITGGSLRQLLTGPVLSLKCMSTGTVTQTKNTRHRVLLLLMHDAVSVRSNSLEKGVAAIVVSLKKSNGTSKNGRGDVSAGGKLAEKRIDPKGVQPTARGK